MPPRDSPSIEITASEFEQLRVLARNSFGLELRSGKEALVLARLGKLLRTNGCTSFRQYYRQVTCDPTGEQLTNLINALTTNFTSFFRERTHFDYLKTVLEAARSEPGPIRIWSAGCATGEEAYSIACEIRALHGTAPLPPGRYEVFATDISTSALRTAARGIYASGAFAAMTDAWRQMCLQRGRGEWAHHYRFRPEIRSLVRFQRVNLLDPLSPFRRFRVIFCRNVMIYFGRELQEQVVNKLALQLDPGGYLFTGHAESLSGLRHPLTYVQPAVYRRGHSR